MKQTDENTPENSSGAAILITAAGSSSRFDIKQKKEFFPFYGETVLHHTIRPFLKLNIFSCFCVTIPKGFQKEARAALGKRIVNILGERLILTEGGDTRQESVHLGLEALIKHSPELVLIHDGARPRITQDVIMAVYSKVLEHKAAAPIIPSVDAMKTLCADGTINNHLERAVTVGIQTPQGFNFPEILDAHRKAVNDGHLYIDDTEIYHQYCGTVYTVPGDPENTKITYYSDIQAHEAGSACE